MIAEIIAVGTELLLGQIVNTNARFLSVELSKLGINVYYQTVVGDNSERLRETLALALKRADIVILTGGLGPTKDDLTKETVAQVLDLPLELHEESLERIKDYFKRIHREMADNNIKQAYLPKGCYVLENNHGTAPGCIVEKDKKIVIMLPGPPKEMEPMFHHSVYPFLRKKTSDIIYSKVLRVFGIGESSLGQKIADLIENQTNPTIAPYAKQGEVTLRITAKSDDIEKAKKLIEPLEKAVRERFGIMVYGEDEESLEEVTCRLLMEKNITIATAESCTGGLLAEKITRIPGISQCFHMGVITYSNEAKQKILGVSAKTLERYGAVSSQTAMEMAEGIKKLSGADIGVSITGIAGPGGGSELKPVGLVYIGMATPDNCSCQELHLSGNRDRIRELTSMNALDMVRKYLQINLT